MNSLSSPTYFEGFRRNLGLTLDEECLDDDARFHRLFHVFFMDFNSKAAEDEPDYSGDIMGESFQMPPGCVGGLTCRFRLYPVVAPPLQPGRARKMSWILLCQGAEYDAWLAQLPSIGCLE